MYPKSSLEKTEELRRELGREEESAGYCCKTAYTVSINELPPEQAF